LTDWCVKEKEVFTTSLDDERFSIDETVAVVYATSRDLESYIRK